MTDRPLPRRGALVRRLLTYRRCEGASAAIEFAAVVPMVIAIVLATLQIAVIYTAQSFLEAGTEAAARSVLTNQAYSLTQAQFNTQVCSYLSSFMDCSKLVVQLQPINCTSSQTTAQCITSLTPQPDSTGNYTQPTTFNPGAPSTKMALVVLYPWPVVGGPLGLNFGSGSWNYHLLSATQVFQIELCTNTTGC
jgi:Flp pilus assembly protein TadG